MTLVLVLVVRSCYRFQNQLLDLVLVGPGHWSGLDSKVLLWVKRGHMGGSTQSDTCVQVQIFYHEMTNIKYFFMIST